MKIRTILEGNAFYEIDEECMEKKKQKRTTDDMKNDNYSKEEMIHASISGDQQESSSAL